MKLVECIALIASLCTIAGFLGPSPQSSDVQEHSDVIVVVYPTDISPPYNKFTDHGKYYFITWDKELVEVDRDLYYTVK